MQSSVWQVRDHYYDRKKKIQSSVCWVHGSSDYDWKKKPGTLALRGLEEPAHASRGLEELFLQLCSFWFWQEIGFGFTYYLCT